MSFFTALPPAPHDPVAAEAPIGIVDSGVGALSVLRHVAALLPFDHIVCFADSGHAPYGSKTDRQVVARMLLIARFLREQHVKAIVVACNTATAAAIDVLRQHHPDLIVVGVEPGVKPAAVFSQNGKAGVLATEGTIASSRFQILCARIAADTGVHIIPHACIGLAEQIEKGELSSAATFAMVKHDVLPLLQEGVDTLALGCTHYPFIAPLIDAIAKQEGIPPPLLVDTGQAVARQLERQLQERGMQRLTGGTGHINVFTTGDEGLLRRAFADLLGLYPPVKRIAPEENTLVSGR